MIGEIGNFKMKKLLLILLCLPLLGWGQDLKGKDDLTFEEYKKQEQQKYSDFEKKMILELNNYIVLEEEWNIITVSQKGNIKDVIISNNDIIETNEKKEIVISKENKKPKKEVKPDYVIEKEKAPDLSKQIAFISPLKSIINNFGLLSALLFSDFDLDSFLVFLCLSLSSFFSCFNIFLKSCLL